MAERKKKSLARSSVFNVMYQLLNVAFPLVTAMYITRVLTAQSIGEVAYAQNIVTYFTLAAALGIPNYGTREIARVRDDSDKLNRLFSELFLINFTMSAVCFVAFLVLVLGTPLFEGNRVLLLVAGTSIALNVLNVDWFYRGEEEYEYITKRSFVVKLATLVLMVLLVRTQSDYLWYAALTCVALAGNYIFNVFNLRRYSVRLVLSGLNPLRHMRPIIVLFATTIAIELYTVLDTTMVGMMGTAESVAYYQYAMKISKMLIILICSIGAVLLPHLSNDLEAGDYVGGRRAAESLLSVLVLLIIPCGVGLFLMADPLVAVLFGPGFGPVAQTLRITSLLVYTLGLSNLFGIQILVAIGREKHLFLATCCGAAVNVTLNALLIPLYGQNGAAIASVICELVVTIVVWACGRKVFPVGIPLREVIKMVVAAAVMALAMLGVHRIVSIDLVRVVTMPLVAVCVYAGACWLLKVEAFQLAMAKVARFVPGHTNK